ncbi:S41 family peptidase, partial [Patescibacteria group bacterium]
GRIKSKKSTITLISILVIFFLGYFFGYSVNSNNDFFGYSNNTDFSILSEANQKINSKYIEDYRESDLIYGALEGMVSGLGDPYSGIIRSENIQDFYQEIEGEFEGIGIEIAKKDGDIVIVAPLKGYPAEKKGIFAGDIIVEVDGVSTTELTLDEIVSNIRGKAGTKVKLKIFREKTEEILDFEITREKIEIDSVAYERIDGIGYIRIVQFDSNTESLLEKSIKKIKDQKISKIILDLRDNPGGYLDSAIKVAENFVAENKIIMYEQKKNGQLKTYKSDKNGKLKDLKLVILQNQGSASASEIVASAIRDNRSDVQIVGFASFGKGLIQEILELSDKTLLRLSTGKWLTSKKKNINEKGIDVDIEIELSESDIKNNIDSQKNKALSILGGK